MRKVIVNSTPLIVLCGIGQLFVLRELYQEIWLPEALYRGSHSKRGSGLCAGKDSRGVDPCGKNPGLYGKEDV